MTVRHRSRGRRGSGRLPGAPVAVALVVGLVGSCTAGWASDRGGTSETCISWAGLPDDESRVEAASVVVDGRVLEAAGQRRMFGTRASVWDVEVVAVVKGELGASDVVQVASTPQTCSGETYPDGDPLGELDGVARLYLHDSDFAIPGTEAGLALINPFQGIGDAS